MFKMTQKTETLDKRIKAMPKICCVCHSLYRPYRDEWVEIPESMHDVITEYYDVTQGYCGENCMTKSGVPENIAKKVYEKLE